MDEPQLFVDLGLLLLAALGGGLLAQVLRQPLIVGDVLAGILVGPFPPRPRGAGEVVLPTPALAGRTLRDAAIRERSGATIVTLRRGDREMTNPAPEEMLQPEDRIFAIGTAEQLALLTQLCEGGGDGEGFTRSAGKP